MSQATISIPFPASPVSFALQDVMALAEPELEETVESISKFRAEPTNPQAALAFEKTLAQTLRKIGRKLTAWTYNHLEPEDPQAAPARIEFEGEQYRRKTKSRNRGGIGTLFGSVELERIAYEPTERGEKSIFPLEINLGIESRNASCALAARVGKLATQCTQTELLSILKTEHQVDWSVRVLRQVTSSFSEGMMPHLHAAQVAQVLLWLEQAQASRGKHKVCLAVGRDGIFLPIRHQETYKEGAVATVSVYDRHGDRLGTVYLAHMPEPLQPILSDRLTRLIEDVLGAWEGLLPRLAYVTDAGWHESAYFEMVLELMADRRRPGKRLEWIWIVDFYHASEYVGTLAAALFGDSKQGHAWARKMCKWLKHKPNGVYRVLHSAAKHHSERELSAKQAEDYQTSYGYLKNHRASMDYAGYRRCGLPIGSGVTEAACKTVFTQRFKQSGMSWDGAEEGQGQKILDLRVIRLSGLWDTVHEAYLASKPTVPLATESRLSEKLAQKAA